jgi:hypothetical protein
MAFDCVFVDFQKNKKFKDQILDQFPYARVTPFVVSYYDILKSFVEDIRTEFFWLATDLVDTAEFDFDYIPEQHEQRQIHVWNTNSQTEGDLMLIPTAEFKSQIKALKFLRDFKDINYHNTDLVYNDWSNVPFVFDNLITQAQSQKERYTNYYYEKPHPIKPSFWEDQKLYIYDKNRLNLLVPKSTIQEELYEYSPKYFLDNDSDPVHFDVCYIHNGEPQAEDNLRLLKQHLKDRANRLHEIAGVKGRKEAYQTAARASNTEYFYAVFAKLKVNKDFAFNFVPDTLKSPRHYIFDCYNPVIDYTYGHQAVILYNKKLVLENNGAGLDFTLAQKHDHISLLSAETTFYTDPRVCYRTAFREIVKLLYNKKLNPTVENNFILNKWLNPELVPGASYVQAAGEDARNFVESHDYDFESIFKSYEWDYVDRFYDQRYS